MNALISVWVDDVLHYAQRERSEDVLGQVIRYARRLARAQKEPIYVVRNGIIVFADNVRTD